MGFIDEDLLFQVTPIEQISPRGWPRYASLKPKTITRFQMV